MIIVLIHWRIKPTAKARRDFRKWWSTKAKIDDKTNLAGEFLSLPLHATEFPFKVDDLSPERRKTRYQPFINVGVWKDWRSFYQQVGKYFRDDKPPLAFESQRRTRTILKPTASRIGRWKLPKKGSCQ